MTWSRLTPCLPGIFFVAEIAKAGSYWGLTRSFKTPSGLNQAPFKQIILFSTPVI